MFSAWFAVSPGFACKRLGNFKPFWPPALAQQALLAIILQALRRLRGAVLFHRVGPSLSWGCPFWVLGLTRQSSRPAYCGRLTLGVSPHKTSYTQAMLFQTVFSFSGVIQRLAGRFSGLRLQAVCGFQAFWAASPCAASASSYHFSSSASPPWRCAFSRFALVVNLGLPVLAVVANRAVKPTCLRQAAYFRSLAMEGA